MKVQQKVIGVLNVEALTKMNKLYKNLCYGIYYKSLWILETLVGLLILLGGFILPIAGALAIISIGVLITSLLILPFIDIELNPLIQLVVLSIISGTVALARWIHKDSGGSTLGILGPFPTLGNSTGIGYTLGNNLNITLNAGDTLELQEAAGANSAIQMNGANINGSILIDEMTNSVLLNTLRGDLGQWEYLKGIMNMFNLVMLQDKNNPNNIR